MKPRIQWWSWIAAVSLLVGMTGACHRSSEPKLDPLQEKAQEHYRAGRRLFLSCYPGNYQAAAREFEQALALWSDYPEALAALAETFSMWRGFSLSESEFDQAYKFAQRSQRLDPRLAAGYRALADLLRHRGDLEGALSQIDTAIQLDPLDAESYYVKGSILISTNLEQARDNLLRALRLNPELAKTYFNLGAVFQQLQEYDNAEKSLLRYQSMVPDDAAGYTSLGILYAEMGRKQDAQTQFQKVVTKAGDQAWEKPWKYMAYLRLGELAWENDHDTHRALAYLDKALEINPESAEAYYSRGLIFLQKRDKKKAREALEQAILLKPDFPDAQAALAKTR